MRVLDAADHENAQHNVSFKKKLYKQFDLYPLLDAADHENAQHNVSFKKKLYKQFDLYPL